MLTEIAYGASELSTTRYVPRGDFRHRDRCKHPNEGPTAGPPGPWRRPWEDCSASSSSSGCSSAWWRPRQRGYFGDNEDVSCKEFADTALTIVAGPLNYVGVNPKVECENIDTPQPSE